MAKAKKPVIIDGEEIKQRPVDAGAFMSLFDATEEDITYKEYHAESSAEEIPLFELLKAIDTNDMGFYDRLSPERKKKFSPWMSMRWASSAENNGAHYLWAVNELVNKDFDIISKHPKLFWMLLSMCGAGNSRERHKWCPPAQKSNKIQDFMWTVYPMANRSEIDMLISMYTTDELIAMARDRGVPDSDSKGQDLSNIFGDKVIKAYLKANK